MKNNKIYLIVIIVMVLTFVLSACTGGNNVAETPVVSQTVEVSLPDLGQFVVVVPKTDDGDYSLGNQAVKQKIIDSIAAEKGVQIDIEVIELPKDNFTNELNNLLVSGTKIDAVVADYGTFTTFTSVEGLIKPIDSLLNSHGTNLYNAIEESYWEEAKLNGEIYGVPSVPYPEESIMVARGDLLYLFIQEEVTEYNQLAAICKFYKNMGYEYPLAATWDQLIDMFAISFRTSIGAYTSTDHTNSFIMREQEPEYVIWFMEEMKLLYDNGYLHPNFMSASADDMKAEVMAGRSAIYITEFEDIYDDRDMIRSILPNAELKLIAPISTQQSKGSYLSCEEKVDNILMFTQSGQNSEALMTYLDWAYSSQLNHTMTELGAYGEHIMYNPVANQYEYIGTHSVDNKPYNGLYTFALATDLLYTPPVHAEYSTEIIAENTLQKEIHAYLTETQHYFSVTVDINDTAQSALEQYTSIMRQATEQYIKGEINIDEYNAYDRQTRNNGLVDTLAQEIGVAYLYEIGAFE